MIVNSARNRLRACAYALLATSCGGNVDLGRDPSSQSDSDAGPGVSSVLTLSETFLVSGLTLAGENLYLTGGDEAAMSRAVYRCQKDRCGGTLTRLAEVPNGWLRFPQASQQSLGFYAAEASQSAWLGSCALPDCATLNQVLAGLPTFPDPPLYYQGFAYWVISADESLYRCSVPACSGGPTRLGPASQGARLSATGDAIFWQDSIRIFRALELGAGAPEALAPEATLRPVALDSVPDDFPYGTRVLTIATADDHVYAVLANDSCDADCLSTVARWPAHGDGARQTVLTTQDPIQNLWAFSGELAWKERAELFSCQPDDCDATRRSLGPVDGGIDVVADESALYWFVTPYAIDDSPTPSGESRPPRPGPNELRTVPRLR